MKRRVLLQLQVTRFSDVIAIPSGAAKRTLVVPVNVLLKHTYVG